MVELDVNGVCFSHGSTEILKGITFSVGNGEVVGILGENGSGKTTLLRCINDEYRPSHGSVIVSGFSHECLGDVLDKEDSVDVRRFSVSDRAKILATVEQSSHQSFPFTVMETVRMGRYSRTGIFDVDSDDELDLICSVMEDVGILEFADRSVNELSGGEWRRVMIAQALAQEPEVLLLDEPTLHLDISHQFDLMDLCREIARKRDVLIVVVTHDLQLAARYCDKVVVMRRGEIVSLGPAREAITESMIRDVFHMDSRVSYDETIDGVNILLIGRSRPS